MADQDDGLMPLDEALALWIYLQNSPQSWAGPGAVALNRAHRTIRHYGELTYTRLTSLAAPKR